MSAKPREPLAEIGLPDEPESCTMAAAAEGLDAAEEPVSDTDDEAGLHLIDHEMIVEDYFLSFVTVLCADSSQQISCCYVA